MNDDQPALNNIDWTESGVPISNKFNDVYFSTTNGLEESRYVFLAHNNLEHRWQKFHGTQNKFCIIETGFGTGLNFLAAWMLWRKVAPKNSQLHFVSIEKYPLTKQQLTQALTLWPELAELSAQLLANYPPTTPGQHRIELDNSNVCLTLIFDDIETALNSIKANNIHCDAWFLDGFAPSKNPEMWSRDTLSKVVSISSVNTSFATFTAVGRIRRDLQELGFNVTKAKGFGIKHEMLHGSYAPANKSEQYNWYSPIYPRKAIQSIAVIGAGLAGAHVAYSLAKQGYGVSVFESEAEAAQGGSGNQQGILYTRLSPERSELSDFSLSALLYSYRYYQQLFNEEVLDCNTDGELSGSIQLAFSDKTKSLHNKLKQRFNNSDIIQWLSPKQASDMASIPIEHSGFFLPASGWLNPVNVCKKLLAQTNIKLHTQKKITALSRSSQWILNNDQQLTFDAVIICSATAATELTQVKDLPLKAIRGQISYLPLQELSPKPKLPVCYEGYLPPPQNNLQCIGATFNLNSTSCDVSEKDHQTNLTQIRNYLPLYYDLLNVDNVQLKQLQGRASIRCTTPDYTPIAGQVVDRELFAQQYMPLSKDAKKLIQSKPPVLPNLYISVGYGSRGLSYSPLCAQHIISLINSTPTPLASNLVKATHPARFILRDIVRGKLTIESL